jgi:acyl-CoA reductase-like NAD-dependent aldehyde dehydrogenase
MDTQTEKARLSTPPVSHHHEYVEELRKSGAPILAASSGCLERLPEGGYYLSPTIITGSCEDDRISQEENFGPWSP